MLVLSRKRGQKIMIGDDIEIEITRIKGGSVGIGITAPEDIKIARAEILKQGDNNSEEQPA